MSIPRRTLEELMFIYERDPDRHDVFVEGPFDAAILDWFFRNRGIDYVVVYEISSVEIPAEILAVNSRKINNRERVIYLAEFYHAESVASRNQLTCLADADFSHISGEFVRVSSLVYTDYSCMEMYFFDPVIIDKLVSVYCYRSNWPIRELVDGLAEILQEFFLYRYANEKLGWSMAWLENIVCVQLQDWTLSLDHGDYIKRYLNKNGRMADLDIFREKIEDLRPSLRADRRYQMHGHDFVDLLEWVMHERGIKSDRHLERVLAACADYSLLGEYQSWKALVERVGE